MSVYIKGMEMPTGDNNITLFLYPDGKVVVCGMLGPLGHYEAVPVPPHGRLGDLDKLADNMRSATAGMEHRAIIMHEIRRTPTIIPAEEGQ